MQVVVAGGGPAGAIAARTLAKSGIRTILFEAAPGADKPCGGALPSMLLDAYPVPELIIKNRSYGVTFQGPSGIQVPIDFPDGLYIALVQRCDFDSHLRFTAEDAGATLVRGRVLSFEDKGNQLMVHYKDSDGTKRTTEADFIIAADGAVSRMAKQVMGRQLNSVIAIQDEFKVSQDKIDALENRCLFNYSPAVSPDFYGWIFPKDGTVSIGIGTDLNQREKANGFLERMKEIHKEFIDGGTHTKRNGAMIPMEQYKLHGYKRVLLTGDSAGLVLPAAGEGIYFAMRSGEIAANAISEFSKERPDLVVQKYTDRVNSEFGPIFKYWMRVQNVAYKSTFNRETFVRLASDKFMGQKILKAFASKSYVPTPIAKRMQILMYLLSIRANVYFHSSREPDFGK